jgi:hypothetical protein
MSSLVTNEYEVVELDLGVERNNVALNLFGSKLVVYKNTGNFSIRLNRTDNDKIDVAPLTYPNQIVIDNFLIDEVYITNSSQPGNSAVLIVFRFNLPGKDDRIK